MGETPLDRYVGALPKSSILICAGAKDGGSIERLAALGRGLRLLAFELDPAKCERLRRKFRHRPTIEIENIALTERAGALQFFRLPGGSGVFTVTIARLVALDQYCRERRLGEIALLKVDTRTFACAVLEGAEELLRERRIGAVTLKGLPVDAHGRQARPWEAHRLMAARGYRLVAIGAIGWSGEEGVEYRDLLYLPALCHSPKKEIL